MEFISTLMVADSSGMKACYYWFGEHKIEGEAGNRAHVGVHVYSSEDLYNWQDRGIALAGFKRSLQRHRQRVRHRTPQSHLQQEIPHICDVVPSRAFGSGICVRAVWRCHQQSCGRAISRHPIVPPQRRPLAPQHAGRTKATSCLPASLKSLRPLNKRERSFPRTLFSVAT